MSLMFDVKQKKHEIEDLATMLGEWTLKRLVTQQRGWIKHIWNVGLKKFPIFITRFIKKMRFFDFFEKNLIFLINLVIKICFFFNLTDKICLIHPRC